MGIEQAQIEGETTGTGDNLAGRAGQAEHGERVEISSNHPDVTVTLTSDTAVFTPHNHRAAQWLHGRCNLLMEDKTTPTEIFVHPHGCRHIIEELEAQRFVVGAAGLGPEPAGPD